MENKPKHVTEVDLKALAGEIISLGYDKKTAWKYAVEIGDTPLIDEDGNVIVMNENETEVIAKLKLKHFTHR